MDQQPRNAEGRTRRGRGGVLRGRGGGAGHGHVVPGSEPGNSVPSSSSNSGTTTTIPAPPPTQSPWGTGKSSAGPYPAASVTTGLSGMAISGNPEPSVPAPMPIQSAWGTGKSPLGPSTTVPARTENLGFPAVQPVLESRRPSGGQPQKQPSRETGAASMPTPATQGGIPKAQQDPKSVGQVQQPQPQAGLSTGSIAGGDGRIVTNNWINRLPDDKKSIQLPSRRGEARQDLYPASKRVKIFTNHYPLQIKFPPNIHHYHVDVSRVKVGPSKVKETKGARPRDHPEPTQAKKMPNRILQKIIKCGVFKLKQTTKNKFGIASDLVSNIYSTERLERTPLGLEFDLDMGNLAKEGIPDPDPEELEEATFHFSLIHTGEIDTASLSVDVNNMRGQFEKKIMEDMTRIYNAVIKCMPNYNYLAMGRSLLIPFPKEGDDGKKLGGGLTSWNGISASIAPGWKFHLNVENAYSTMRLTGNVLAALQEQFKWNINDVTTLSAAQISAISGALKTCKVTYRPMPRTDPRKVLSGVVKGVHKDPAHVASFTMKGQNGGRDTAMDVAHYFKKIYNTDLRHRNGPVLILRGGANGDKFVPAELCVIKKGQSVNRKLDEEQTRQMVTHARKNPNDLKREIQAEVERLKLSNNKDFQKFGIALDGNMLELDCRVLDPPNLRYDNNVQVTPQNGTWDIWNTKVKFAKQASVPLTKWGLVCLDKNNGSSYDNVMINRFVELLQKEGRNVGMSFGAPEIHVERNITERGRHQDNVGAFVKLFKGLQAMNCNLVMVVLPPGPKSTKLYGQLKQASELKVNDVGITTQCIMYKNFSSERAKSIVQNILLKINAKLDGITHRLIPPPSLRGKGLRICPESLQDPIMIIGADVTHPPPGSDVKDATGRMFRTPSFAAVTASVDPNCIPFGARVQAQQKADSGSAEVIVNLDKIVEEFIILFLQRNKILPGKILYYRDGVGEGQFTELMDKELRAIQRACSNPVFVAVNRGVQYEPKVTFITVQKRHKTRFFLQSKERPGTVLNAPPGTVVDSHIVHPTQNDFYLLSHTAIQGTSRPTRYHCLWDDNDFSPDEIQHLTYFLCYMYSRCTRAVRIPAATYYSHWAAARAKIFAEGNEKHFENLDKLNEMITRHVVFESEHSTFPMHFI